MPSYHDVSYRGINLHVKPLGWRQYLPFLPYSQGDSVKFRVSVKGKGNLPPLAIYEDLILPETSHKERYPIKTDYYDKTPKTYVDVFGSILLMTGLGRYTIDSPENKDAIELVTFNTWLDAKLSMLFLNIMLPVVVGIVMFLLGRMVN